MFSVPTYGLSVSLPAALTACLIAAPAAALVFSLPKYRRSALAAWVFVLLLVLWSGWDGLSRGAASLFGQAAQVLLRAMGFPGWFPFLDGWEPPDAPAGAAMVFGVFVLALLLGWTIAARRSFSLTFLCTFPWVFPAFLAELPVFWPVLLPLGGVWMTMLLTGLAQNGGPADSARLEFAALSLSLLALIMLGAAFPADGYVPPRWTRTARIRLTELGNELSGLFSSESLKKTPFSRPGTGTDADARTVDLSAAGPRRYTGRAVLEVDSGAAGPLYLRGFSLAEYTGTQWLPLDGEALERLEDMSERFPLAASSLYFPAAGAGEEEGFSITVTHLDAPSSIAYTPYQTTWAEARFDGDSCLRFSRPARTYLADFVPWSAAPLVLTGDAAEAEEAYREFAYRHYTAVPEEAEDALRDWLHGREHGDWSSEGLDAAGAAEKRIAAAQEVARLLEMDTQYDLSAPFPPEDADFAAWFLNDSRRGYCVHYASAAALLLRLEGIPTRYVSGYAARWGQGEVPDSAAHAWIEIYLDGCGWYPVEVTPAGDPDEDAHPDSPEDGEQPSPDASAPPDTSEPEQTAPDASARPEPPVETADPAPAAGRAYPLLLAPVLALALWRLVRHLRWLGLFWDRSGNRAVISAYGWFQKLAPWGGTVSEEARAMARKARFSQHTLSARERAGVLEHLRREVRRCYALQPLWKRPAFAWLFVFEAGLLKEF